MPFGTSKMNKLKKTTEVLSENKKDRLKQTAIKSSEEEFIWELENSYELSPKLSSLI